MPIHPKGQAPCWSQKIAMAFVNLSAIQDTNSSRIKAPTQEGSPVLDITFQIYPENYSRASISSCASHGEPGFALRKRRLAAALEMIKWLLYQPGRGGVSISEDHCSCFYRIP